MPNGKIALNFHVEKWRHRKHKTLTYAQWHTHTQTHIDRDRDRDAEERTASIVNPVISSQPQ